MNEKRLAERAALRLAYFTVTFNVMEGALAIVAALVAGSAALLGFGVDSFVESLSGAVMIWRFSGAPDEQVEKREQHAVWLVGLSLLALVVYVVWEAGTQLYYSEAPDRSPIGVVS